MDPTLPLVIDELTLDALSRVIEGETCILVVRRFCADEIASKTGQWLLQAGSERYDHEIHALGGIEYVYYGVDRVGVPFNKTLTSQNQQAEKEAYYQKALKNIRALRAAVAPCLSPIDRLRLDLDEIWPTGAGIAAFEGRKMMVGIGRVIHAKNSSASESPHYDAIPRSIATFEAQLAANIFVVIPEEGGELEVWNVPPLPAGTEPLTDLSENWRDKLPQPIVILPRAGDLILFNAGRPHATRRFARGSRVSVQCFIGVRGDARLELWN